MKDVPVELLIMDAAQMEKQKPRDKMERDVRVVKNPTTAAVPTNLHQLLGQILGVVNVLPQSMDAVLME